ncbi:MAG: isoprenoid biosynthesis glyoxalase ElbB [Holophagaceae bacterium]|nr:isoprenoid biosynthesis glyoxalase ElbB [Holophagaceae bacterium]
MSISPKVAVLLAGCGHLDGAEIRESVFALLALDQHGATFQCIAPNATQHHVIDHTTGQVATGQTRNILEESSRIARVGQCMDISQANPDEFSALVIPGGFGVAKNHCSYAFDGPTASVRQDVSEFVKAFFIAKKPVGAICISPALIALILAGAGLHGKLTLGSGQSDNQAMETLEHEHVNVPSAREIVVDNNLKLVTTPAYMIDNARLADIFIGIERCVSEVLRMV